MALKYCIALDRDGTVSSGNPPGPIPLELVRQIMNRRHDVVFIAYGNYALTPELGIPYAMGNTKRDRLTWIRANYSCEQYINIDDEMIVVEGWLYMNPLRGHEFLRSLLL